MSFELEGRWTYRSYRNDATLIAGDAEKALRNIFGEGVFTLVASNGNVTGMLDMGSGYVLDLSGTVMPVDGGDVRIAVTIVGTGRSGTPTAGWEYDYQGTDAFTWPEGVDQIPAIVGSVLRGKPHDGSPAGYVASFIAIKQT